MQWESINVREFHEKIQSLMDEESFKPFAPYGHFVLEDGDRDSTLIWNNSEHDRFVRALTWDFQLLLQSPEVYERVSLMGISKR